MITSPPGRRAWTTRNVVATVAVLIGVVGITLSVVRSVNSGAPSTAASLLSIGGMELGYSRLDNPGRSVVRDNTGTVVATLTDGARTANLAGPERTFADPDFTTATVTTSAWVRLLPEPWTPGAERQPWFRPWLDQQFQSQEPDVLAVATQYLRGQPDATDAQGVRYRGDAAFGPPSETSETTREERSDFYDYLGLTWTFADGDQEIPDPLRYGNADCSGFLRLVYGYRMGIPLRNTNTPGPGLPRRAFAIAQYAPGVSVIPDHARPVADYSRLLPGDLVFFNLDADPRIDHSAIYLGVDDSAHHRFLSSRGRANGPTLGDLGGTSLLDDGGHYSRAFRTAKRL